MRALAVALLAVLLPAAAGVGCGKGQKKEASPQFLSAAEIYEQARRELQEDDLRQAQSLLEQITYSTDDRAELEPLVRLAIADATFYQDYGVALIDARSLYQDFVALYGDHALAPYAQFQAGVCSLKQVVHPSRDQAQTHQAIADLGVVSERWPNSSYAGAARSMIRSAEHNLAEHEFMVGRFYLHRKTPAAAVMRFEAILDRYPDYREMDKIYYHLGQAELAQGHDVEARIWLDKVVQDYPHGPFYDEAVKVLEKVGGPDAGLDVAGGK